MEKLLLVLIEEKHITVNDYQKFDNFIIFNNNFFFKVNSKNFIEIYVFYSFDKNKKNLTSINLINYISCWASKGLINQITFITPIGKISEEVSYEGFSSNIKKNLKHKELIILNLKNKC